MDPIPRPETLDANRVTRDDREEMTLEDHRSQSQLLTRALDESCAYARQLWEDMDAMRRYLHGCLPPDPRTPGTDLAVGASPTGPDDELGWQRWIDAYAEVTSVLCGPHGDSGYGRTLAAGEARVRRDAPVNALKATHPDAVRSVHENTAVIPGREAVESRAPEPVHDERWSLVSFSSGIAVTVAAVRVLHRLSARRRAGMV